MGSILFLGRAVPGEIQALGGDYSVIHAQTSQDASRLLAQSPGVVVVDVDFPIEGESLEALIPRLRHQDPMVSILLAVRGMGVTHSVLSQVVGYLVRGATQFLELPSTQTELIWTLSYAMEETQVARSATHFSVEKLQEPAWKTTMDLFVALLDQRREKGVPISTAELQAFFPPNASEEAKANIQAIFEERPRLKSVTLLTIDDEPDIRRLFGDLFKPHFSVVSAANAEEGLAIIQNQAIYLVFLDITMPGKRGDALVADIKACSPDTEIVMVSGNADFDLVSKTIHAGASDYILKPFDKIHLRTIVFRLLQHRMFKDMIKTDALRGLV
ncbi:MAG: response regulator [Candidatus Margulisiibacteriota bacterium]